MKVSLHEVGMDQLQFVRQIRAVHTLLKFDDHAWIVLYSDHALAAFEQLECEVACAGPDLKHNVSALHTRLLNHRRCHQRVLEQVLSERMVQLEKYLRVLMATPELALSPPVCAFLDAIDVAQFRSQLSPTTTSSLGQPAASQRATDLDTQRSERAMSGHTR